MRPKEEIMQEARKAFEAADRIATGEISITNIAYNIQLNNVILQRLTETMLDIRDLLERIADRGVKFGPM